MRDQDGNGAGVDSLTLEYAKSFLGTPYIWGGASPGGIDCSGLIIEILASSGILKHGYDTTAQGLYSENKDDWVHPLKPLPGSLVFYGKNLLNITHVAFCLDGYRILEAGGGGSHTKTVTEAWESKAFVRIRPLNYRKDFVTYLMPIYSLA